MQELDIEEIGQVGGRGAEAPAAVEGVPEPLMQPLGWCFGVWWQ